MIATTERLSPLMERIESGEDITQADVDRVALLQAFDVVKLSQSQKIGDIISPVVSVKREDTLGHALNLMANEEMLELAIVDDEGRLAGEVKLTDVMTRLLDFGNKTPDNPKNK